MICQHMNIRACRRLKSEKAALHAEGWGGAMSNVAGKAYGMNVVTPMRPCLTWLQRAIFMASRALPSTLGGLLGLSIIHFARWVLIKRDQWPDLGQGKQKLQNDYMLFCSNFNGTWDQYIDAFSDGIPNGLDLFWYSSTRYPHSIPITSFKNYIRANQIDTDYYYNATPGAAQRDIKAALRIRLAILELAKLHKDPRARGFPKGLCRNSIQKAEWRLATERPWLPRLCAGRQQRHG